MEKNINIVKGTHDIYGDDMANYRSLYECFSNLAERYGFEEILTPTIEHTSLFARSVGEGSDIVSKEMYTFMDKSDRSITLRPELTAGVLRAVVTNKMTAQRELPLRLYYLGQCFRYERPQAGRYREFHQFGVEAVGVRFITEDLEVISLAKKCLELVGLDKVKIKINYLGGEESRLAYRNALKEYFKDHIENMCEDCKHRYEVNPLRILDCKVPDDRPIIEGAPKILDYLSAEDKEKFDFMVEALKTLHYDVEVDQTLVRGLDYYTGVVFELHSAFEEAPDFGALGGGGHYAKLLSELGGPELEGSGFSIGMERVISLLAALNRRVDPKETVDVFAIGMTEEAIDQNFFLAEALRSMGVRVQMNHEVKSMKSLMKLANKLESKILVILGEDELQNKTYTLKDLTTGEQKTLEYVDFFNEVFTRLVKIREQQNQVSDEEEDNNEDGGVA